MDLFVYTFHHEGNVHRALSVLNPATVGDQGIPTESVLGEINALLPSMTPDQFEANDAFLDILHQTVQKEIADIPEYREQARVFGTGVLPIMDLRAGKITGESTDEDMIGQFIIRTGNILPDSYIPNSSYKLLTDNGPIQLHSILEAKLLDKINYIL
ncbi:MAG: hypothetical protein ACI9EW_000645 [Cellvibrionaceae bacterium]|jgi:hypothetical protein